MMYTCCHVCLFSRYLVRWVERSVKIQWGYSRDTVGIQWGYSEDTERIQLGYSEDTVGIQWGYRKIQWGYSGYKWRYSGDTKRIEWGYSGIQWRYCGDTVGTLWGIRDTTTSNSSTLCRKTGYCLHFQCLSHSYSPIPVSVDIKDSKKYVRSQKYSDMFWVRQPWNFIYISIQVVLLILLAIL